MVTSTVFRSTGLAFPPSNVIVAFLLAPALCCRHAVISPGAKHAKCPQRLFLKPAPGAKVKVGFHAAASAAWQQRSAPPTDPIRKHQRE
jgi:hypothetical protein